MLKLIIKYFFYPRMIIADEKYNLLCFMLFLCTFYFINDSIMPYYISGTLLYLIIGQSLPRSWLKEFYNCDGFDQDE